VAQQLSWKQKKKNKGSKELENYITIRVYSRASSKEWASSGVAILVRKDWKNKIILYEWTSLSIVKLGLKLLTYIITVSGIYAPAEEKTSEAEEFYDDLHRSL
jgi:hypothetical protein